MKSMKKVIWTIGLAFLFAMSTKAATNPYEKTISLCDGCGPAL